MNKSLVCFCILISLLSSCSSQSLDSTYFQSIDLAHLEGKKAIEGTPVSYPYYQLKKLSDNNIELVVTQSKQIKDYYQFEKNKNIWFHLEKVTECDPCDDYILTVIEPLQILTFLYTKKEDFIILDGIITEHKTASIYIKYRGIKLDRLGIDSYANIHTLVQQYKPWITQNVEYKLISNRLNKTISIYDNENNISLKNESKVYELKNVNYDSNTWWSLVKL